MNNLPVFGRVPQVGMVLDDIVTDTNDEVGPVKSAGNVVVGLQSDCAQAQVVGTGHDALCHEGCGNRYIKCLGEGDQLFRTTRAYHAIAGHNDWVLGIGNYLGSLHDLGSRRIGWRGKLYMQRLLGGLHLGNVLREIDEACAGLLYLRELKCLANNFRDVFRLQDLR